MYHIKNDPRSLKSCILIRKALLRLLKEKKVDIGEISVSELASASGVGRATFYRHFDRPLDVLVWSLDTEEEFAVDSKLLQSETFFGFACRFFSYWTAQRSLLELIVLSGQSNLLLSSLERSMTKYSKLFFKRAVTLSPTRRRYLIRIWAATIWAVLRCWTVTGMKESPEELADIAVHAMPVPHA